MKSVGITTTGYGNNYGEALQAFAIRKAVNIYVPDHQAELIDYTCINRTPLTKPGFEGYEERLADKQLLFEEFRQNEIGLSGSPVSHLIKETAPVFDQYVFGSDQIWNTGISQIPEFFGSFVPENRPKIAYAASIGLKPYNQLLDRTLFERYLAGFKAISVREQIHCDYVQQFTNVPVRYVADPTLLLDVDIYKELLIRSRARKPDRDYIFYYHPNSADGAMISLVNKVARSHHMDVVHTFAQIPSGMFPYDSISARFDGPREFLSYIQDASLVITRSYHGVIFSILFRKPFYAYVDKKTGSRFESLLATLGLEDRMVYDYLKPEDVNFTIDYQSVSERLTRFKKSSIEYLRDALR